MRSVEPSGPSEPGDGVIEIRGLPAFAHRPPGEPGAAPEGGASRRGGPRLPARSSLHELERRRDLPAPLDPRFHALSRPATALSGDLYLRLRRGEVWLFGLGDVAGHGLEASIYMMMIQEEIERLAADDALGLPAIVAELHGTLRRELPGKRFASLVLAELHPNGRMEILNAGHPPPLLRRSSGEILALPPNGPILGPLPASRWSSLTTRLRPDDGLLLVSDGVLEAQSPAGEEFGAERLWQALERHGGLEPKPLVDLVFEQVVAFRGDAPLADDTTLLALRA